MRETQHEAVPGVPGQGLVRAPLHELSRDRPGAAVNEQAPIAERDVSCTTPGCEGDARYPAPGRSHRPGCPYPMPALPVGTLTIPAAARLVPGDLIRVLGPRSWELVEPDDTRVTSPVGRRT